MSGVRSFKVSSSFLQRCCFNCVLLLLIFVSIWAFTLEMRNRVLVPALTAASRGPIDNSTAPLRSSIATMPKNLDMHGSDLVVGASVVAWVLGFATLLITSCVWTHGEQNPKFLFYLLAPSQILLPSLSAASLISIFAIHARSSHIQPEYLQLPKPGLYGSNSSLSISSNSLSSTLVATSQFDLETWACEMETFPAIVKVAEFEGICRRAYLVRFSLVPLVVLSCVFAATSAWVAVCERRRVMAYYYGQQGVEEKKNGVGESC